MIMDESYKQELLEYIAETPDLIFEAYNHTRESVLQHIEELWTAYQKDVEEYECTADWSYADAMQEVLGILIPNNAAPWKASEPTKSAEQMTYADKIRQMSDEELAKLLTVSFTYMNGYRPDTIFRCTGIGDFDTREEAEEAALEMLKKPANLMQEVTEEAQIGEKEQKNGWILTDDDSFQIRRKIEEDVFELYQIDATAPSWEEGDRVFRVSHAVIYICDINQDSMMDCYGYESLEAFKEEYGDDWKGVLAECDFEITSQNGEYFISSDLTWKEAKKLICKLSGYQEETDDQDAAVNYRVCGLQFPLEDGITADGIQQLLKMVNGETFDFLRVDAEFSAAIFIINSDVYAQWESQGILLAFKAFVREILDDKEKETEDSIYSFEDARILNEDGTVATHSENIYLSYC